MLNNLDDILRALNGDKNPFEEENDKQLSKAGFEGYDRLREILQTMQDWGIIPTGCNWEDALDEVVDEILLLGF